MNVNVDSGSDRGVRYVHVCYLRAGALQRRNGFVEAGAHVGVE
jgi:hypothetical protein